MLAICLRLSTFCLWNLSSNVSSAKVEAIPTVESVRCVCTICHALTAHISTVILYFSALLHWFYTPTLTSVLLQLY
jgi:hypothetical protein